MLVTDDDRIEEFVEVPVGEYVTFEEDEGDAETDRDARDETVPVVEGADVFEVVVVRDTEFEADSVPDAVSERVVKLAAMLPVTVADTEREMAMDGDTVLVADAVISAELDAVAVSEGEPVIVTMIVRVEVACAVSEAESVAIEPDAVFDTVLFDVLVGDDVRVTKEEMEAIEVDGLLDLDSDTLAVAETEGFVDIVTLAVAKGDRVPDTEIVVDDEVDFVDELDVVCVLSLVNVISDDGVGDTKDDLDEVLETVRFIIVGELVNVINGVMERVVNADAVIENDVLTVIENGAVAERDNIGVLLTDLETNAETVLIETVANVDDDGVLDAKAESELFTLRVDSRLYVANADVVRVTFCDGDCVFDIVGVRSPVREADDVGATVAERENKTDVVTFGDELRVPITGEFVLFTDIVVDADAVTFVDAVPPT